MILYFTGTGNSRYTAQYLSKLLDDELICINNYLKQNKTNETFSSQRPFIFVTPVYAWRIPKLITGFIQSSTFTGTKKAYFIITCGDSIGNAEKYLLKLCGDKRFHYMGCMAVQMPENYLVMFKTPSASESAKIIQNAKFPIEKAADAIKSESTFPIKQSSFAGKLESGIINNMFYTFMVKANGFYATDKCIECRKCESVCPLNNISCAKGQPSWGNRCTHCMACICSCPTQAIEYKKSSIGKNRFYNNFTIE